MTPLSATAQQAEAPLFTDGLGDRVVAVDGSTGDLLQILRVRPQLLAAWIPAVMIAFGGALVYAIIVNAMAWPVMKSIFGDKVKFTIIAPRRPLLRRLGVPGVGEALDAVEERALWTRFGLAAR